MADHVHPNGRPLPSGERFPHSRETGGPTTCHCLYMDGTALEWAARVQRLEAEVDGLRRAMRSRAVIEQAKGFLSAALNCGLDEAFGHLARLSQHENLRVAEVAARIIGTVIPTEDDGSPEEAQLDARLFDPLTYLHGASPGDDTTDEEPAQSV